MYGLGGLFLLHFSPLHLDIHVAGIKGRPKLKFSINSPKNKLYRTILFAIVKNRCKIGIDCSLL